MITIKVIKSRFFSDERWLHEEHQQKDGIKGWCIILVKNWQKEFDFIGHNLILSI